MQRKLVWPLLAIGLVLVLVAAWARTAGGFTPAGSVIEPPRQAPEIQLTDESGNTFLLSERQGQVVLLFFGYTYCPDVCPGTLKDIEAVFGQLGERAGDVRFVFITVDPARDTPKRLREYLAGFHPAFTGLTGTAAELELVYRDYSVQVTLGPAAGVGGYDVEHTSRIFVIDRLGRLVETFPYGLSRPAMLADIQHWISE